MASKFDEYLESLNRTFRQILDNTRFDKNSVLDTVYVVCDDVHLHYYMMRPAGGHYFKDVMNSGTSIEIPEDKLDTYGYYFELNGAQAVVTTIHSEATMLIRKALRTIQKRRNPDTVNVTLTEDIWKPRFDRGPDYKDPPQPSGYIPDIP